VIAMMQRKGGATLAEIVDATGWQKHTVRGFISILDSKGGMKITSTRRESDKARVYAAAR
jgi:predicted transcriptional regulator